MRLVHIFVIVCALAAFRRTEAVDYCQSKFCTGGKHIACTNKNGAFASICGSNVRIEPITTSLRQVILNEHNLLRNKIAKGGFGVYKAATRMASLQWDAELAKLAELNVKQCTMKHENCRKSEKYQYGQNLAWTGWKGEVKQVPVVTKEHVNAWFNEYKDASMTYINRYSNPTNGKVIGHFTQMLQDKATYVGCAILRHTKNGWEEQYMACNYSYPNFSARPVYEAGRAASKCKTGVNPSYKFLCSVKEKY